ncbi:MAG: Translation elongation factor EF-1 alpha GTPase [Candidatus Methanohalarchaeum thermophilum]|uniref:Elongation factor 1-alpha n=1 Tax=Methanohalarchaeum thermophilum TaxID=1903181 RepID=A0A1Q6DRX9_METT1|nr:MAG: Translation elongation factor EF-1 alpha GTPase [Candidatus Methanohalarchaeum thermophilum]
MSDEDKPHLNLALIGHVDHGKSTLVGRLLYETGNVPEHVIEEYKKEAEEKGKSTFEFAWVMDELSEERERGLTIDIAHKRFDTDSYYFTIVDCPGHRDFVKNMITGASQADAAVLVVDASEGVMPQTKEHVYLSKTLGIDQMIVAVNKMDKVDWDENKYEQVESEIDELLKRIGYKPGDIQYVPISALEGGNIAEPADTSPWYDGPNLLEELDNLKKPEEPVDLPLRIPIQDVYSISGIGTVPVGRVETGKIKPEEEVRFEPSGKTGEVKSIEMHHEEVPEAGPGDNIGFNIRGVGKDEIQRGDVAGHTDNPPTVVDEFTAQIIVLSHPSAITAGYTPVFHAHTSQVACTITEILQKKDPKTGEVKEENPDFIKQGDSAVVKVKPQRPLVIEKLKEIPQLGRFAIRDMGQTVATGAVMDLKEKE